MESNQAPQDKVPASKTSNQSSPSPSSLVGFLLLVIGGFLLLRNLEIIDPRIDVKKIITTWWPLLLIHVGVGQIACKAVMIRYLWYIALIAILAYLLLQNIF